jgi:hypothetical protein
MIARPTFVGYSLEDLGGAFGFLNHEMDGFSFSSKYLRALCLLGSFKALNITRDNFHWEGWEEGVKFSVIILMRPKFTRNSPNSCRSCFLDFLPRFYPLSKL